MRVLSNTYYRLMAMATVAALSVPTDALAQAATSAGVGKVADNIGNTFGSITKLLLNGSLLAGLGLSGAGLLKLKQASDDGGQRVKYSEGMWRLGVGGALAALPFVASTMQGTIDSGTGGDFGRRGEVTYR